MCTDAVVDYFYNIAARHSGWRLGQTDSLWSAAPCIGNAAYSDSTFRSYLAEEWRKQSTHALRERCLGAMTALMAKTIHSRA